MERIKLKEKKIERAVLTPLVTPDLAARRVIIHAFLYYVMDAPLISDGEYDALTRFVARNWEELHPDRQWALGSAEEIRTTGSHVKYSCAAVGAAINHHKYSTGEQLRNYGDDVWRRRRNGVRFVTGTAPRPEVLR